eukprot:6184081-Pleurochrysis_carterae.AAC.1
MRRHPIEAKCDIMNENQMLEPAARSMQTRPIADQSQARRRLLSNICIARLGWLRLERETLSERSGKCAEARGERTLAAASHPLLRGRERSHLAHGARAPVTSSRPIRPAGLVPGRQTKVCGPEGWWAGVETMSAVAGVAILRAPCDGRIIPVSR